MSDIRTFIAVDVDNAIIARLAALQQELKRADVSVSWSRPEGMHLTLKFLGNVPEERISAIGGALREVAAGWKPFRVSMEGAGGFPTLRRPRVLWIGIREGREALIALAGTVDTALAGLGFPPEDRPFSPHLTLGRVKAPARLEDLTAQIESHARERFGEMTVNEIILFQSELSPKGAKYTPLRRSALGGERFEL